MQPMSSVMPIEQSSAARSPAVGAARRLLRLLIASRRRRWTFLFGAAILLPILFWSAFQLAVICEPYPQSWKSPADAGTFLVDRNGVPLAALVARDGQWQMPLRERDVSSHLFDAMVAVEDARFYRHGGVDWESAGSALFQNIHALHIRRGASTITMQLQRLRDPRSRTFLNKLDQSIRACQIERASTKRQILLEYVNRAPFGGNLVGAGAASWRYFGKPCANLSLAEAATLAGLPQNPAHLRPDRFAAAATQRRNHVLDRMLACGFISRQQHDDACTEQLLASWRPLPQDRGPGATSVADGAMPTLIEIARHDSARTFSTTIDSATQQMTYRLATESRTQLRNCGISAVAVVVLDTATSQSLAAVSVSEGHATDLLDLTHAARSTGSTLKPLIYAAAFDAGICGPQTLLDDSPTAWPGYQPADFDRSFRGPLPASEAMVESRNIPALLILQRVGVPRAIGLMEAAGLKTLGRTPDRYGLALAIGGAEATPTELATAYAMLGRGGICRDVVCVLPPKASPQISTQPGLRCLPSDVCWQVLTALSAAERTRHVCPEAVASHVAWKTGTSSGHKDAWCAAVTSRHVVVVWLGNPSGSGSPALVGQEAAAPLALRIVAALEPTGAPDWPAASSTRVAAPTQLRASQNFFENGPALTLVSPAADQTFVIDPDIRREAQRIRLCVSAKGGQRLWWFVDEQPQPSQRPDLYAWWAPELGDHTVRVVNATGQSASANFHVVAR